MTSAVSRRRVTAASAATDAGADTAAEAATEKFLDTLKWDANGFVVANAQDIDSGEILMTAFANREAVRHTLSTRSVPFP